MFKRSRATADETDAQAFAASIEQVKAGLRSMHDHCLTNLGAGLRAMTEGNLAVAVAPVTTPIDAAAVDPFAAELVELFNSILAKTQTALTDYNTLREELRSALGDQSCLTSSASGCTAWTPTA